LKLQQEYITFGNRLNYSGNNLPSYKNSFSVGPLQCYQQSGFEKTNRLMRLCLQFFTCRKNKESENFSRKEDNIKLVEIDVEITKIDSFLKTIRITRPYRCPND
jgi:hypothetical protein